MVVLAHDKIGPRRKGRGPRRSTLFTRENDRRLFSTYRRSRKGDCRRLMNGPEFIRDTSAIGSHPCNGSAMPIEKAK